MLTEFKKIRQVQGVTRRLFTDNYFDLYVWYNENTTDFIGFQLVYAINDNQMALTAELGKIPNVRRVESGDGELYGPTDLLDGQGIFLKDELYTEFSIRSTNVESFIKDIVLDIISKYHKNRQIPLGSKLSSIY